MPVCGAREIQRRHCLLVRVRAVMALLGLESARFGHDLHRCIFDFVAIARAAFIALLPGGALATLDAPLLVTNSEKSVHSAFTAQMH
jgi:hypothetical protein